MGRIVVIGAALVIGVGVVGLAWMLRDDEGADQVTTAEPGELSSHEGGESPPPTTTAGGPDGSGPPGGSWPSVLDGPLLDVSALSAASGQVISVAGAHCGVAGPPTVGDWEVRIWLVPAPGTVPWDPTFGEPVATEDPAPDGTWTVEITVPEWSTEYRLEAACFDEASPPAGFLYRHERLVSPADGAG